MVSPKIKSTQKLTADWNYPTNIRIGAGRVRELAECCRELGMRAPLLVTGPGLATLPMTGRVVAHCREAGLKCEVFSAIKSNPTGRQIEAGVRAYKQGHHDGVIAFGGGSALDAGKAVALMVEQEFSLWDFEDIGDNWSRADEAAIAPIVAVPTTAGTGSEVGRTALITDERRKVKKIIFHPRLLPQLVILDPVLTIGLPAGMTAATGMDALARNLEAYFAPFYHPMAEGIALEGLRRIKTYLPLARENGKDLVARAQILVASSMGAAASQRGLGAMSALSHTLGAFYGTHHGLLNAVLMPYVLLANRPAIEQRCGRLAAYLELRSAGFEGLLLWILDLRRKLGIPNTLAAIGIDETRLRLVGAMAAKYPCAGDNPVVFSAGQYAEICRRAVRGEMQHSSSAA